MTLKKIEAVLDKHERVVCRELCPLEGVEKQVKEMILQLLADLREAMKYVEHNDGCRPCIPDCRVDISNGGEHVTCTCGLDALRKRLE